jgi:hypothetical protein
LSPGTDLLSSLAIKSPGTVRGFFVMGSKQIALSFSTLPSRETVRCPQTIADDRASATLLPNLLIRASVQQFGVKRTGLICACDRAALMRFRFWVCRPDKAAFKNMLQHLRRIIARFDLLIMESFYLTALGN